MINKWGICTFDGIVTTQMTRWDLGCKFFSPKEEQGLETGEKCCAHCVYWLVFDDQLPVKGT